MAQEFEGDLSDAVFWGADLSGARFRDVNLTNVVVSHALLANVDVDATIERVVINGVDVTDYVNERDRWHPLRAMLRPTDPAGLRGAWAGLEAKWTALIARAQALPPDQLLVQVDGEWSFVQTLRHLVFAMDKWFTSPILDAGFDPIGWPNTGSIDFPWPSVDRSLDPSFAEILDIRAQRAAWFRDHLASLTPADLIGDVEILENGIVPKAECYYTVFEEEFWHLRYAERDLAVLEARS